MEQHAKQNRGRKGKINSEGEGESVEGWMDEMDR